MIDNRHKYTNGRNKYFIKDSFQLHLLLGRVDTQWPTTTLTVCGLDMFMIFKFNFDYI